MRLERSLLQHVAQQLLVVAIVGVVALAAAQDDSGDGGDGGGSGWAVATGLAVVVVLAVRSKLSGRGCGSSGAASEGSGIYDEQAESEVP